MASPIHKCPRFPSDGDIITIYHFLYKPSCPRDCVEIDFYWPSHPEKPPAHPNHLYRNYQKHKVAKTMEFSLPKVFSLLPFLTTSPSTSKHILPSTSTQLVDVPSLEPMVIDLNSPNMSCNTNFNQHAHQCHKKN